MTPVVVTLPLTALSGATVMVPLPEAEVVTGGTSWLPLSAILTAWLQDAPGYPAIKIAAAPTIPNRVCLTIRFCRFIGIPPLPSCTRRTERQ